jgi:hypothetical protein
MLSERNIGSSKLWAQSTRMAKAKVARTEPQILLKADNTTLNPCSKMN